MLDPPPITLAKRHSSRPDKVKAAAEQGLMAAAQVPDRGAVGGHSAQAAALMEKTTRKLPLPWMVALFNQKRARFPPIPALRLGCDNRLNQLVHSQHLIKNESPTQID